MTPDAAGYGPHRPRAWSGRPDNRGQDAGSPARHRRVNGGLYFDGAWLGRASATTTSKATGERYLTGSSPWLEPMGGGGAGGDRGRDGARRRQRPRQLATLEPTSLAHPRAPPAGGRDHAGPDHDLRRCGVELGPDVVLEPNVLLRGQTRIGAETVIGAGGRLSTPRSASAA
jgi:hypothetical protein